MSYTETVTSLSATLRGVRKEPEKGTLKTYVSGFPFAFQTWSYETMPFLERYRLLVSNMEPRMLRWRCKQPRSDNLHSLFFLDPNKVLQYIPMLGTNEVTRVDSRMILKRKSVDASSSDLGGR